LNHIYILTRGNKTIESHIYTDSGEIKPLNHIYILTRGNTNKILWSQMKIKTTIQPWIFINLGNTFDNIFVKKGFITHFVHKLVKYLIFRRLSIFIIKCY
jgi:hypothetical protein